MHLTKKILWAFFFVMPFLLSGAIITFAQTSNDTESEIEVNARVARISFIRSEAQIKRADSEEWERAGQNLPLVEGDEIATDGRTRLEIQFNSYTHLRLSENSRLKITTLRDEGVAVSLPQGTLTLRARNFDKARGYFEIDAPQTTVSVQKAGMFRVDAGSNNEIEVRVSAADGGQARIYTENSGFTLRSGRTAQIQISGEYSGEWETADAARFADEFDSFSLERDTVIAKLLQKADYDKYYDQDIYGAEDLSEHGEWIYTKKYGYVWKPFGTATANYTDWSPYRYGQWRWIPPFGWTWVNDEPWGWATYHHGRWVYDSGWYWTPYPAQRTGRSWWRPALVIVNYIAGNVCWYPLPYNRGYYNYNHNYHSTYIDRRRYNTTVVNNTTVVINPTPTPLLRRRNTNSRLLNTDNLAVTDVPVRGVIGIPINEFGIQTKNFRPAPLEVAKKVLLKSPTLETDSLRLPNYKDLSGRISREIRAETPKLEKTELRARTGVTNRIIGVPLDENLRKARVQGERMPLERIPAVETGGTKTESEIRNTGAVRRPSRSVSISAENSEETRQTPRPRRTPVNELEPRSKGENSVENRNQGSPPARRPRENTPERQPPPSEETPQRRERNERRQLPPVDEAESPRPEPPPKREKTRTEPKNQEEKPEEPKPVAPLEKNRRVKDSQ
ncbi:MAG: DUF6600 domain-containing protein [Pyrinomonadaceae bacterium]